MNKTGQSEAQPFVIALAMTSLAINYLELPIEAAAFPAIATCGLAAFTWLRRQSTKKDQKSGDRNNSIRLAAKDKKIKQLTDEINTIHADAKKVSSDD